MIVSICSCVHIKTFLSVSAQEEEGGGGVGLSNATNVMMGEWVNVV